MLASDLLKSLAGCFTIIEDLLKGMDSLYMRKAYQVQFFNGR